MEKIILKPAVKELIYKNGEEGVHFDVLSYQGVSNQEKNLGFLFVVGHIKYSKEDLSYAISLISSLAKREYYSEKSFQELNTKSAFERTLKKLNEALRDFFQNKDFKLSVGLVAISGENVYISRLGKFKIALARDGKYIDILNNIDLFNKDPEGEDQFSNIISGKLQPKDKLFAYFPTRPVTAREKQLNDIFVKEGQEEFGEKIAHLAANANNFTSCGVHIAMEQIKEIPVQFSPQRPKPVAAVRAPAAVVPSSGKTLVADEKATPLPQAAVSAIGKDEDPDDLSEESGEVPEMQKPRIIPAELSMIRKANLFTALSLKFRNLFLINRISKRARYRSFAVIAAIVILPLLVFVFVKNSRESGGIRNALKQAEENIKLAQSQLTQNNPKEARSLLQTSLANIADFSGKKIEDAKQQVSQTLDNIDRASDKQSQLFADLSGQKDFQGVLLVGSKDSRQAGSGDQISVINASGSSLLAGQGSISSAGELKLNPRFLFNAKSSSAAFNGTDIFAVYNRDSQKSNSYTLKEPLQSIGAVLYEDNLYVLVGGQIYKYADAATGGVKRTDWGGDAASGEQISIAADGNIYTLTAGGKLIKLFKGKKAGEVDLQIVPSSGSRIFIFKDSAFAYLADKAAKRVYVFDKESGALKVTYKLDSGGDIRDVSVSQDGTIWALSGDNKVWQIKP